MPAGDKGCKTNYRAVNPEDEFDFEFGENEEQNWNKIARGVIELQLNMKNPIFTRSIYLGPNDHFFMVFEQDDRRWYTLDDIDDLPIQEFSAAPIPFKNLKTIQVFTEI